MNINIYITVYIIYTYDSVVTWKDIIKYLQICEGCTHFCEMLYTLCVYLYIHNTNAQYTHTYIM